MIAFGCQVPDKSLAQSLEQTYAHVIDHSKRHLDVEEIYTSRDIAHSTIKAITQPQRTHGLQLKQ
jgi:hypothetical protein